ncbi:MAG: hypothetical protein ACLGHN_06105 [Bacteriovoracia bacterium]
MILPSSLRNFSEWILLGPMGPELPSDLYTLPLMAVDGGAHFATSMDIWVGDADSYSEEIHAPHVIRHPIEKDQSDLALALNLFNDPCHYKLHLWGFLGGRRDHELFNLGEALSFLDKQDGSQILFYNESGKITYQVVGSGHWKFSHQGLFSLGALKRTEVTLRGDCYYPIKSPQILTPLSSFGLSNIGQGEMTLTTDGAVFLYFPEGK